MTWVGILSPDLVDSQEKENRDGRKPHGYQGPLMEVRITELVDWLVG